MPSFYKGYKGPRNCTTFALAWALLFLAWPAELRLSAQFSSGVNIVEVYAAVTDAAGNPVTGLRRDDFTVLEDGRPQTVTAFAEGDFPLSVAIGVDRSFSMTPRRSNGRPEFMSPVMGARTFLNELRPQDESMIVAIGSEI